MGDRDDRRGRRRRAGLGVVERRARPHDRRRPAARLAEPGDAGRGAARVSVRRPHHRGRGHRRRRAGAAPQPVPRRRRDRRARARARSRWRRTGDALRRGRRAALRSAAARRLDCLAGRRGRDRSDRRRRRHPPCRHAGAGAVRGGCGRRRRLRGAGGGDVRRPGADPRRAHGRPPRRRRGAGHDSPRRQPGAQAARPGPGVRDGPGPCHPGAAGGARLAVGRDLAVDPRWGGRATGARVRPHLAARRAGRQRGGAGRGGRRGTCRPGSGCRGGRCGRCRGGGLSRGARGTAGDARSRAGRSRRRRTGRRRAARRRRSPGGDPRGPARRR